MRMGNCKCFFFRPSKNQPDYIKQFFLLSILTATIRHLRKERGTGLEMRPAIVSGMVAEDALISYWLVLFSLLLLTVPEAFARANLAQSFSRILSGEFMRTYNFTMDLALTSMVSSAHWLETE